MPFELTDIAILLVSVAACIYCIVLSRRLKALQNTKDGLGATITALNQSVAAVSSATDDTRRQAGDLATRLARLMGEADQMCARMESLTRTMESNHAVSSRQVSTAQSELNAIMREMLEQSYTRIKEMRTVMTEMRDMADVQDGLRQRSIYLASNNGS